MCDEAAVVPRCRSGLAQCTIFFAHARARALFHLALLLLDPLELVVLVLRVGLHSHVTMKYAFSLRLVRR